MLMSLQIELGFGLALINLTGIPSKPEAFLPSRPFMIEMTSDSATSERWNVDEASVQMI